MAAILVAAAAAFVASNLDDLILLLALFAVRRFRTWTIVAGQYLGIGVLTAIALACAQLAAALPRGLPGQFGIVPIGIGIWHLFERHHAQAQVVTEAPRGLAQVAAVAAVTIGNGADNVGIYMSLLVGRSRSEVTTVLAVTACMVAALCFAARAIVSHPRFEAPLRTWGPRVFPLVLIALGVWIMWNAGAVSGRPILG